MIQDWFPTTVGWLRSTTAYLYQYDISQKLYR